MVAMHKLLRVLTLLLLVNSFLAVQAEDSKQRLITVTGKSSLKLDPDKASVSFAIINKEKKAESARKRNETASKRVLNAVRDLGVKEKLLKLESMQIHEEKKYNSKTRTYDFDGYKAARSFVVELHDLDLLAEVIAAVISEGSNELSNVEYGLKKPEAAKKLALKDAMVNAIDKTDLILSASSSKRGKLVEVNELSNNLIGFPRAGRAHPRMLSLASADAVAEKDSYAQGQIEIESSVRVLFEIID